MSKFFFIIFLSFAYQCSVAQNEVFTNDEDITKQLKDQLLNAYDKKDFVSFEDFQAQLSTISATKINTSQNKNSYASKTVLYNQGKKSTLILGKLFDTESSGSDFVYTATATVISPDGVCITNHHVFEEMTKGYTQKMMGVMDYGGNFYKITEVLASSENDDLAVFKIDPKGKKLQALNFGELPEIGSEVHVIGHPKNAYYTYTTGVVSRLYIYDEEKSDRISITADFAVGSSGGPILNDYGQLIGMVAATVSVPNSRAVQMVVKEIIPISSITKLINKINAI